MAVVAKKKPEEESKTIGANSRGVRKDEPATKKAVSSKKNSSVKASKKNTAAKKTASKKKPARKTPSETQSENNPVKHRKIQVLDTATPVEAEVTSAQELDPFEIAKKTMKGSVPAIVEAMVEAAKQGSYTHAKTLLEMTGAKHMFDNDAEEQNGGEPWAKLVLARLDEAEADAGQVAADLKYETLEVVAE